jgi:GNAT superfamily N-acetyltransferase
MTIVDESHPNATPVTVWHLVHSGVAPDPVPLPDGFTLVEPQHGHAAWSARMYAQIGAPWHWVDRRDWTERQWQEWVASPGYWLGLIEREGQPVGYAELVGATEIGFFGIDAQAAGIGLGRWLLTDVVRRALARPTTTALTVHTCSLDHPAALANYTARGFSIERTETEWRLMSGDPAQSAS